MVEGKLLTLADFQRISNLPYQTINYALSRLGPEPAMWIGHTRMWREDQLPQIMESIQKKGMRSKKRQQPLADSEAATIPDGDGDSAIREFEWRLEFCRTIRHVKELWNRCCKETDEDSRAILSTSFSLKIREMLMCELQQASAASAQKIHDDAESWGPKDGLGISPYEVFMVKRTARERLEELKSINKEVSQ